jgi:hypothetical protein
MSDAVRTTETNTRLIRKAVAISLQQARKM